jgi:hypothetical protein
MHAASDLQVENFSNREKRKVSSHDRSQGILLLFGGRRESVKVFWGRFYETVSAEIYV